MIGVTIGVGKGPSGSDFGDLAQQAAASMREHTGLECVVLGENELHKSGAGNAQLLKAHIFELVDADEILFFDADIRCVNDWAPCSLLPARGPAPFFVVRDFHNSEAVIADCYHWQMNARQYFNTGLFIANREAHAGFFAKIIEASKHYAALCAFQRREGYGANLWDQTLFNYIAYNEYLPLKFLDRRYNWIWPLGEFPERVKYFNAHYAGDQSHKAFYREGHMPPTSNEIEFDMMFVKRNAGDYELTLSPVGEAVSFPPRFIRLDDDGSVIAGNGAHEHWWFVDKKTGNLCFYYCRRMSIELWPQEDYGHWAGHCTHSPEIKATLRRLGA